MSGATYNKTCVFANGVTLAEQVIENSTEKIKFALFTALGIKNVNGSKDISDYIELHCIKGVKKDDEEN